MESGLQARVFLIATRFLPGDDHVFPRASTGPGADPHAGPAALDAALLDPRVTPRLRGGLALGQAGVPDRDRGERRLVRWERPVGPVDVERGVGGDRLLGGGRGPERWRSFPGGGQARALALSRVRPRRRDPNRTPTSR